MIIANPAAGGFSQRRVDRVVAELRRLGCLVTVRLTGPATGDAERLSRDAGQEFDVIVAAGGDGTLNAVANGLGATGRPLALLPFGTANVVARDIGLPHRPQQLARLIANGTPAPVWPGRVSGRLFLGMASCGFDAEIVASVRPLLKRRIGRAAFAWATCQCLWRYRDRRLTVRVDGAEYPAATIIAANGRYYAGPFVVAPDASLTEPTLDLVLFQRSGRRAVLRYLIALLQNRLPRRNDVFVVRCRRAVVTAEEPLAVQADGEPIGHLPVTLSVAVHKLWLLKP